MASIKEEKDKQFPLIGHKIARLFEPPKKFIEPFVKKGQIVADLGSGPGYYALHFAQILGPKGKVYAVDSDQRCIKAIEKKARRKGFNNIDARATSASDLSFIKDNSVDFIFSNGLLCSIAPKQRDKAVAEMKRILKSNGKAYLSAARGSMSYLTDKDWEKIIKGFKVVRQENKKSEYIAEVTLKE